jgi:hypothetical protein
MTMSKKGRQHDEEAWSNAKACRLNARQVEMARALGMNPKKLPGLRPSPQQRWKLPVGEFIEECYAKRFGRDGSDTWDIRPREPQVGSSKPSNSREDVRAPGAFATPTSQAENLVCYLINLADDLQQWIGADTIDPEVLPQVAAELREIVEALDTGASIPQVPETLLPPRHTRAKSVHRAAISPSPQRYDDARTFDDDDIPF